MHTLHTWLASWRGSWRGSWHGSVQGYNAQHHHYSQKFHQIFLQLCHLLLIGVFYHEIEYFCDAKELGLMKFFYPAKFFGYTVL